MDHGDAVQAKELAETVCADLLLTVAASFALHMESKARATAIMLQAFLAEDDDAFTTGASKVPVIADPAGIIFVGVFTVLVQHLDDGSV